MNDSDEPIHDSTEEHAMHAAHNNNHNDESVGSYPVEIDELLSLGSFDLRLTNSVQMELQENARLPTFYGTVDRSGSSGISRRVPEAALHSPSRRQRGERNEDNVMIADTTINWGELFLNDRQRVSYHGNYKEAGVLKEPFDIFPATAPAAEVDNNHHQQHTNHDEDPNDYFIHVDPTPLSEMKRHVEERQREQHTVQHNEGSRHHPYSRSTPLAYDQSINNNNNSDSVNMAHAIATAAALASTTHRPLAGMSKLPPASAGVLRDISTKKKKHGFGAYHVVPSVPESNTRRRVSRKRPPPVITTHNTFVPMSPPQFAASGMTGTNHMEDHDMNDPDRGSPTNPGDAYERKKQRAKDARVKLNESIDRMHISIRLALTQSQQRLQQSHQNNALTIVQKEKIGPLLHQTIRIAETAKKWDRPSFVGSAAALIQMLNAQCEALMLMVMDSNNNASDGADAGDKNRTNTTNGNVISTPTTTPTATRSPLNGQHKRHIMDDTNHSETNTNTPGGGNDLTNNNKRVRPSPTNESQTNATDNIRDDGTWFTNGRILECVASFLNPQSIVRCHFQICKTWTVLDSFGSDAIWERLVLQRFGHYCVRQWRDKLHLDDTSPYPSFLQLYKSMDTANAIPHIASVHQHNEGWFLLGETRLPGTVSAWVYLIERSNGETLRSVHQASTNKFQSLPIVELRTVLQNTGGQEIVLKMDQTQSVDTSTRRRAEEMKELQGDDGRFVKRLLRLDGTTLPSNNDSIRLQLFESVIVVSYIHAVHCNTISKFVQKSNFTRWLVQVNGTTVPLVIPFPGMPWVCSIDES